jgi:rare lipoprotein A (peptidoglycan hydrolase)
MHMNSVAACIVRSALVSVCLSACATTVARPTPQATGTSVARSEPETSEAILFPLWSLLPRRATTQMESPARPPWITTKSAVAHSRRQTVATDSSAGTTSSRAILFPLWSLAPQHGVPWMRGGLMPSRLKPKPRPVLRRVRASRHKKQTGVASWYGPGFHGRQTANGEIYDQYRLTAAHRTLPLGTKVAVKNPTNGKTVEVRINDRGPYIDGRIIDLSYAAARALGMVKPGIVQVEVEIISP